MGNSLKIMCFLIFFTSIMMGCKEMKSNDTKQRELQESSLSQAQAQIGMPAIKNFQERKLLKMILELRDQENLVTYTYLQSKMTGRLVFVGKSIGFGMPYATQYTNPMRYQYNGATLPQADPNGLFYPDNALGTWIMMIDPQKGQPRPVYFEPEVVVSPFPLM